jgi:septum formation topological specificity factor MinE
VGLGKTTPSSNKNFYFAEVSIFFLVMCQLKWLIAKTRRKNLGSTSYLSELKHEFTAILANFQKTNSNLGAITLKPTISSHSNYLILCILNLKKKKKTTNELVFI